MKKILALMVCLVLLMTAAGLGESSSPFSMFPAPETETPDAPEKDIPESEIPDSFERNPSVPEIPDPDDANGNEDSSGGSSQLPPSFSDRTAAQNSMSLTVMGETIVLDYDTDPEFSLIENGCIQASFYLYGADDALYELYLIFPEGVQTGDEISLASSLRDGVYETAILFYLSDSTTEISAAATQYSEGAFPAGCDYTLRFDSVVQDGDSTTYTGSFVATLVVMDENFAPLFPVEGVTASFSFTMNANDRGSSAPGFGDFTPSVPSAPSAPTAPSTLITPPDAQKI